MTKTIHPLLCHYSSTKWGEGRGAFILNFVSVFYILDVVVGHEMIIANLTIYASLAIYHFISKVCS